MTSIRSYLADFYSDRGRPPIDPELLMRMLNRMKERFDLHPERLIVDTAYGTGPLLGWLVDRRIAPHIPVFDKAGRSDGTWSRADFEWDAENDQHVCPEGHALKQFRRNYSDPNRGLRVKASRATALSS